MKYMSTGNRKTTFCVEANVIVIAPLFVVPRHADINIQEKEYLNLQPHVARIIKVMSL